MSKAGAATDTRLARVRAWMAAHDLEAAYITSPVSIEYLTGVHANPHERLMALAVRHDDATLIVPALERENAETNGHDAAVVSWRDGEDAYALVGGALGNAKRLGVEKDHLTVSAAEALGGRDLTDVAPEIRRLRRTKGADELENLAHAAQITDSATREVMSRLRGGMTEIDVAFELSAAIGAAGGKLAFDSLVQAGPNSALPHGSPSARKLAKGDLVLLDFGAAYGGYPADITRMAVVGEPSRRQLDIHALVLEAHDAAIRAVRAGATTGEVDAAARDVITAGGMGDRFFHRTGHGLGLEIHEDPSLDPGSDRVLEVGMVFTIEPGIYIPGWGGVRIEDDVVVEADGCRMLTQADHALHQVTS